MKIAIIGGGISGLAVARMLHRDHDLTLYEARDYPGGNANTAMIEEDGRAVPVDCGASLFFTGGYSRFFRLLAALRVPTERSDTRFLLDLDTGFRVGVDLNRPFRSTLPYLTRPSHWAFLRDGLRFCARINRCVSSDGTVQELLERERYRSEFQAVLLAMSMFVWGVDCPTVLGFPAWFLVRWLRDLGLFNPWRSGQWHFVPGGVARYVNALAAPFRDRLRLGCPVARVEREGRGGVVVTTQAGSSERYEHVILALPGDAPLRMIHRPSPAEVEVLSAFGTVQHTFLLTRDEPLISGYGSGDASVFIRMQTSWPGSRIPEVVYRAGFADVRRVFHLPLSRPLYVWYEVPDGPRPAEVLASYTYSTPVFSPRVLAAQARHAEVSGADRLHFCSSGWDNGLHEGGLVSAAAVAQWFGCGLHNLGH